MDAERRDLVVDGIVVGDVEMERVVVVGRVPAVFCAVHEEQD